MSSRSVYLINYFKDLRPFSLLINLSKVQIKIVFQGSSMSFAGIIFLFSVFLLSVCFAAADAVVVVAAAVFSNIL